MASYQRSTVVPYAFNSFSVPSITRRTHLAIFQIGRKPGKWLQWYFLSQNVTATFLMLQEALSFFSLHFLLSLFLFFGFFSAFLFSLFPFVQLRKWTLSQRVETRNGVKWRLASPGDSEEPAKPTLCVGNVLTERRSLESSPPRSKNRINEVFWYLCQTWCH